MGSDFVTILENVKSKRLSKMEALEMIEQLNGQGAHQRAAVASKQKERAGLVRVFTYDDPYLRDHRVFDQRVLLGVTHCSLAIEAGRTVFQSEKFVGIRKLLLRQPIILKPHETVQLAVDIKMQGSSPRFASRCRLNSGNTPVDAATGEFVFQSGDEPFQIAVAQFRSQCDRRYTGREVYAMLEPTGIRHGPSLQTLKDVWIRDQEALGLLQLSEQMMADSHTYGVHPAFLDGAIVSVMPLIQGHMNSTETFVPFMVKRIRLFGDLPDRCFCQTRLVAVHPEIFEVDLNLCDPDGHGLVALEGFTCKRVRADTVFNALNTEAQATTGLEKEQTPFSEQIPSAAAISSISHPSGLAKAIGEYLNAKVKSVTGRSPDRDVNFMDLGIDSNELVVLSQKIETELGIDLYPTVFFEHQNITAFTAFLAENFRDKLAEVLKIESDVGIQTKLPENRKNTTFPVEAEEASSGIMASPPLQVTLPAEGENQLSASRDLSQAFNKEVAVIGMSGRFADASDPEAFWQNLRSGKDLIREIPKDHFDVEPWFDPDPQAADKSYCKWGSFIEDVDKFDARFFNISPVEAEVMDPQLRWLLQVLYATTEDAGYAGRLKGTRTGMFVGACFHDYADEMFLSGKPVSPYDGTGNAFTMLSNRCSFYFDISGPSLTVDTACSSSLVALHIALRALQQGECEMALVAGVNLLLSSWHYRYFCSIGALSPTGRCRSFDASADGYVPGEAVAAILLKPLRQAMADKDRILAVIKGSAINHGGYTPSITAPSVNLEARVIRNAWQDAGIDPRTIDYIEAHGTGTKLGDPIEINALKKAFGSLNGNKPHCVVGSVKAHIGHTEGAAGVAAVIRVILSMQHGEIPAMPGFQQLNPYINLDDVPFYINQDNIPWPVSDGRPRRAGVSSFGFGGAYAHVVLEALEADQSLPVVTADSPQVIVLSARNEDRLRVVAARLAEFIRTDAADQKPALSDMAYTLQVGREAMDVRLATVAKDMTLLAEQLEAWCRQESGLKKLYHGHIRDQEVLPELMNDGPAGHLFIDHLLKTRELDKLACLWVAGVHINWAALHQNTEPQLLALPTYPFDIQRYWYNAAASRRALPPVDAVLQTQYAQKLHPILDRNESTLKQVMYTKTLTAQDWFIRDHLVNGTPILPGVVCLEMARAAGTLANPEHGVSGLSDIAWTHPITVQDSLTDVQIRLEARKGGIVFGVDMVADNDQRMTCCQGKVDYDTAKTGDHAVQKLDIEAIKARCQTIEEQAAFYRRFRTSGISHGPRLQTIRRIHSNSAEALAELRFAAGDENEIQPFDLHTALLDGALQAVAGLVNSSAAENTLVPFGLERLEIIAPLQENGYAYVSFAGHASGIANKADRYDIQIVDETGVLRIYIKGFVFRAITLSSQKAAKSGAFVSQPEYRRWQWHQSSLPDDALANALPGPFLIFDSDESLCRALRENSLFDAIETPSIIRVIPGRHFKAHETGVFELRPGNAGDYQHLIKILAEQDQLPRQIIHLAWEQLFDGDPATLSAMLERSFFSVSYLCQALITHKPQTTAHLLYIYPGDDEAVQPPYAAINALARSINRETTKVALKSMQIAHFLKMDRGKVTGALIDTLLAELAIGNDNGLVVRYQGGRRWVLEMEHLEIADAESKLNGNQPAILRRRGVYLITGGTGKLGRLLARYLADRCQAQLVLAGRTVTDEVKNEIMGELEGFGAQVVFVPADVADPEAVATLINTVKEKLGSLHGIFHCAGVVRDGLLAAKSQEEMTAVLGPKVFGSVYLDAATQDEPLDLFVLFSSIASVFGNIGQTDYAYANSFMDHFATWRDRMRADGRRSGRTLAINWPYWAEGGMKLDPQTLTWLESRFDLKPLATSDGLLALTDALSQDNSPFIVLSKASAMKKRQKDDPKASSAAPTAASLPSRETGIPAPGTGQKSLQHFSETYIQQVIAHHTKLPVDQIDVRDSWDRFGIESVMALQLSQNLESQLGQLPPTLFLEYENIQQLAIYLSENHAEQVTSLMNASNAGETTLSEADAA